MENLYPQIGKYIRVFRATGETEDSGFGTIYRLLDRNPKLLENMIKTSGPKSAMRAAYIKDF